MVPATFSTESWPYSLWQTNFYQSKGIRIHMKKRITKTTTPHHKTHHQNKMKKQNKKMPYLARKNEILRKRGRQKTKQQLV
ncbi:hypothetical protein V6Z11_A03G062700 [Gossypium hirsutum]